MKSETRSFLRSVTATTLRSVNAPGRRRIASAVHRLLGPNPGLHEASLRGGGRILIDGERNLDVFYLGEHDPHISAFLRRIVRKGEVIIDVGARFGEYTVPLALATGPTGRVFALEALEANYDILRQNVLLNELTNVTVVRVAVVDRTTELDAPVRSAPGNYSLAASGPCAHHRTRVFPRRFLRNPRNRPCGSDGHGYRRGGNAGLSWSAALAVVGSRPERGVRSEYSVAAADELECG